MIFTKVKVGRIPHGVRGLKQGIANFKEIKRCRTPHRGAWIETPKISHVKCTASGRTSHRGSWIETISYQLPYSELCGRTPQRGCG